MKKEAKACNIKLSELGKLILKQHEDLTTEAYVIKYKKFIPTIGGLMQEVQQIKNFGMKDNLSTRQQSHATRTKV
jgi:phosphohistidine swiveling domain-containing protein